MRVVEAKLLLQNPHSRVSEIAFKTGFDSISQFNRFFKRVAGQASTWFRTWSVDFRFVSRIVNPWILTKLQFLV
ncbi:MAG: helix-turn-helix domain-containing protein [Lentimonas sp.]